MAEIISCPSCQRKLQVPETLVGQDVQCPTCGATFVARVAGAAPPPTRAPQAPAQRWDEDRRPYFDLPQRERRDAGGRAYDDDRGNDDYGTYARRRRDLAPHRGALILTLGIVGLVVLPIVSPIAWILGNADIVEIRAGRMDPEGEGLTQAGRICGIIGTVIMVLYFCFCGLVFFSMMNPGGRY
jgi:hypothetical protein